MKETDGAKRGRQTKISSPPPSSRIRGDGRWLVYHVLAFG